MTTIDQAAERLTRFHDGNHDVYESMFAGSPTMYADANYQFNSDMNTVSRWGITERPKLLAEIERLTNRVLSAAGDDLCRLSQDEIRDLTAGAVQIPPRETFLESCSRFHEQIAAGAGELQGCLTLAQMIAENERLRIENDLLKSNLIAARNTALRVMEEAEDSREDPGMDEAVGVLCSDEVMIDVVQLAQKIEAEAAAFRWLVQHEAWVEPHAKVGFRVSNINIVFGSGTTPLEAVEDAKRRSEG